MDIPFIILIAISSSQKYNNDMKCHEGKQTIENVSLLLKIEHSLHLTCLSFAASVIFHGERHFASFDNNKHCSSFIVIRPHRPCCAINSVQ